MTFFLRMLKGNPHHDSQGLFASAPGGGGEGLKLTQVSGQKGSNPGGIYENEDGKQYYVKFYANPQQAKTEALSARLFESLGVQTVTPRTQTVNGKEALVTPWNDKLKQMSMGEFLNLNHDQKIDIAKMYMAAILTKNWDVVGTGHDNIVKDQTTGKLIEVDTGGSFNFRAQGEHKDYGSDIGEKQSLLNPNLDSGKVFNAVFKQSPDVQSIALEVVKSLDLRKVQARFTVSGLHNQAELFQAFKERRQKLLAAGGLA